MSLEQAGVSMEVAQSVQEDAVYDADVKELHSLGYAQELSRRMSGFSNFAISFSIICILAGGISAFPAAFNALGSGGAFMIWLVGGVLALSVAFGMGQIASSFPTAGGLYHWSSHLGGKMWGWATAWFNLIGLICGFLSRCTAICGLFQGYFAHRYLESGYIHMGLLAPIPHCGC